MSQKRDPATERLDSKGKRVGRRAYNGPGNTREAMMSYPKRNESGLAPGLEQVIEDAAGYIEGITWANHAGAKHPGGWASCDRDCTAIRHGAEILRAGLLEWTGRRTETRIGGA